MKLTELSPEFLKRRDDRSMNIVHDIREADGITFLCPVCFKANGGKVGTHHIICWRPSVPLDANPKPGRWQFEGSSFEDISLVGYPIGPDQISASSVLLTDGCGAHFHVSKGQIV